MIGTAGNLSVRAGDSVVVTPTGCVLSEVGPDEMTVVDLDGEVQDGGPPTSELGLHLGVYERFEWAGAVVHTHSPMATAVGCVLDELPPIHYQMLALGGPVRVAPYATFGSDELHANVLAALEGHTAALMQNHGALTCGAGARRRGGGDVPARVGVQPVLARVADRRAVGAERRAARRRGDAGAATQLRRRRWLT